MAAGLCGWNGQHVMLALKLDQSSTGFAIVTATTLNQLMGEWTVKEVPMKFNHVQLKVNSSLIKTLRLKPLRAENQKNFQFFRRPHNHNHHHLNINLNYNDDN